MGLFRKSRKAEPVPPPPPQAGPEDLTEARRVTAGFLAALGNDAQMRRAAYALSQAGGGPAGPEASLLQAVHTGTTGIDRPWQWLAAVADHPAAAGDPELIARIAAVTLIWHREMRGKLGLADIHDMMLQAPPVDLVTRICSVSARHLANADGDVVCAEGAFGAFTIGGVRTLCADQLSGTGPAASGA